MSRNVKKRTFGHVRPAKIRAVWSESSLGLFWLSKDANLLHADSEDYDKTVKSDLSL